MDSIGFDLYMYCLSTGWKHTDFDWTEYLKECQATAAPDSAFTNLVSGTINSPLNGCHLIFRGKSLPTYGCLYIHHNNIYRYRITVLHQCFQSVVENEFVRGMKLEASNPHQPGQICAATITRIIDNLMWISLDGSPKVSLVTFKQMYKVTWMKDCSHVTKKK